MQLNDQPFAPTLAHKLGDVPHNSRLLRRIAKLSGAGERVAEWLLKVAIARGANHYRRETLFHRLVISKPGTDQRHRNK